MKMKTLRLKYAWQLDRIFSIPIAIIPLTVLYDSSEGQIQILPKYQHHNNAYFQQKDGDLV